MYLNTNDPIAVAAVSAIHAGDLPALTRLLADHPELATARLGDPGGMSRTLMHVVTDWPGHFPNGAQVVAALVAAGADVNARFEGKHAETPLHWAASSDDVQVLDALLDAGADIEADGSVLGGGPPLSDATGFGQWNVARRLVERGAHTTIGDAATLGLMDRLESFFQQGSQPSKAEVDRAFWGACHGGKRAAAEFLLRHGADVNWLPDWERATPLDAALRSEATEVVEWLRTQGGRSAGS